MDEAPTPEPFPGKPGETWEQYAHRLERRIKAQRESLNHHHMLRSDGNKHARLKINALERALGRAALAADRRKEQRDGVIERLEELKEQLNITESALQAISNEAGFQPGPRGSEIFTDPQGIADQALKLLLPGGHLRAGIPEDDGPTQEDLLVLGFCPHGVNLDRDFCRQGCRR